MLEPLLCSYPTYHHLLSLILQRRIHQPAFREPPDALCQQQHQLGPFLCWAELLHRPCHRDCCRAALLPVPAGRQLHQPFPATAAACGGRYLPPEPRPAAQLPLLLHRHRLQGGFAAGGAAHHRRLRCLLRSQRACSGALRGQRRVLPQRHSVLRARLQVQPGIPPGRWNCNRGWRDCVIPHVQHQPDM